MAKQRTFVMIKPDGVQRGLVGNIINRFEQKGIKIVAMKFLKVSKDLAEKHYGIHKGKPLPPVRMYAGKKECGPHDTCDQLAVIISEFMPPYEIIKPLVESILMWSRQKGCKILLSFEGTHKTQKNSSDKETIFGVATNTSMKKILKQVDIPLTTEGMISGVSGVLLYEGLLQKRDVLCLLAEARAEYPDSRAAAQLIEKLDIMLPGIKIDPKPLYKEAEIIEKKIRQFIEQSKPTAPQLPQIPTSMYR